MESRVAFGVIAIAGLLFTSELRAQWTTATLSQGRKELAAASAGNKILFAGGEIAGSTFSNVVDIYDITNDSWSTATLSQARYSLKATSVGSLAMFAGGFSGAYSNVVDIYNGTTNAWSTALLTAAREHLTATTVGSKAMFAGGIDGSSTLHSRVDIYDGSTGLWTTSELSVGRWLLASAAVGNKAFFAGGLGSTGYSNVVDIYDNSTNTWSTATLQVARSSMAAASVGTKVFFAGGSDNQPSESDLVEIYDTSNNSWTTANLSVPRTQLTAVSAGNKIFFAGGNYEGSPSDVVDIYDNATNQWSTTSLSVARWHLVSAAAGSKILFAGGLELQPSLLIYSNAVDIYNLTPAVTSFSPPSGSMGTLVTINGSNFDPSPVNNIVYFGATRATVTSSSSNQITVTVPAGATFQPITVTVNGLTAYSSHPFVLTFPGGGVIEVNSLAPKVGFPTGNNSYDVAMGDIDGDGKPDLIVPSADDNTVSVFRNTSTAGSITGSSFASRVNFTVGTTPNFVTVGDVDGDGKLDLVTSNFGTNTISIIRNTSAPGSITASSFDSKVDFATGAAPYSGCIGDIDGDGRPDLVVPNNHDQTVSVFRNTSSAGTINTSSFAPKVDFTAGTNPYIMAISDIDGDGKPDLVTTNYYSNVVSIFRNTSTPGSITSASFATKVDFATGANPTGLSIGDLDGDGKPDLVVSNVSNASVSVFRNTSTSASITASSFATKVDFATGSYPWRVSIGDIDGDAKPDVVVVKENGTVGVFKNTSTLGSITTGSFAAQVNFAAGSSTFQPAIGDLDGDGKPDLAVQDNGSNTVSILKNVIGPAPLITAFTPASGVAGTLVTITGTGFSTTPVNNLVYFNGVQADVISSTGSTISATVPALATSGQISVTVGGITGTSVLSFTVLPAITNFSPTSGAVGATVTITGTSFDPIPANNTVKFNGTTAVVTASTAISITVTVPSGATSGAITVTVAGQTATSSTNFTVLPAITNFSPTSGPIGTTVTITGTSFDPTPANNTVNFNGTIATVTASTASSITVTVPAGATTGTITVTVGGQTATSSGTFTVLPAIISFTPSSGLIGALVTITGTSFDPIPANNTVKFNGTTAVVTASSSTSITTSVPVGASTGAITVTVNGQTATSATNFTVITPVIIQITSESFPATYDRGGSLTLSITLNDNTNVTAVTLKYKGITEPGTATKSVAVTPDGTKYEKVLPATELTDMIGVRFHFEVTVNGQGVLQSTTGKSRLHYPAASGEQVIPGMVFGNQVKDYQIIAMPLELTNKNGNSVFAALGNPNKAQWRLFDYQGADYIEYPGAFSTINPGKGYWLIVKNPATINPGEGITVAADETSPYTINLNTGWNLIGNPYNFRIAWSEVLAANGNPATVSTLKTFSNGNLAVSNLLDRYRGGFVFADAPFALQIPVLRNTTLGGRKMEEGPIANALDQPHWEVNLTLRSGEISNHLSGIGMHPAARVEGKDSFDEVSLPLPRGLGLFGMSVPHPEVYTGFSKDVVPTQQGFTWNFDVERPDAGDLIVSWNNDYFGDNAQQLMLFNPSTQELTDMRKSTSVALTPGTTHLRIVYGSEQYVQHTLDKELPWLGNAYPNPAQYEVTIPFRVPESYDGMPVSIQIYNSQGMEVGVPVDRPMDKGSYEVKWEARGASGLYIVRMRIGQEETKAMKVVFK